VVPVLDRGGELVAVLDVDSHEPSAFDEIDRDGLEAAARLIAEQW
jgi:GAF domain-containing protein